MGGPAALVDVVPVGTGMDRQDLGTHPAQGAGRGAGGGPVAGVDDDAQAVEAVGGARQQVLDVVAQGVVIGHHPADVGADRPLPPLIKSRLDLGLHLVGELVPAAGEELDAVVGHGVVRRRDHHPEVHAELGGEVRNSGRRQDTQHQDVEAGAGQAGHDGRLEELPTGPGITTHDRPRAGTGPSSVQLAELAQHVRGGTRQVQGEVRRQVPVGQPAHPIGPEQRAHDVPPGRLSPGDSTRRAGRGCAGRPLRRTSCAGPANARTPGPDPRVHHRRSSAQVDTRACPPALIACCTGAPCGPS